MTEEMNQVITNVLILKKGDRVSGIVSKIEEKQALIDVGYRYDGILPVNEISNIHFDNISDVLKEGDKVDLVVLLINEDEEQLVLSKKIIETENAWELLKKRFEANEVFEVVIADVVKGGLVVDFGVRGFIPASLVGIQYIEDLSEFKGKTMKVKIIELEQEKGKVILSQRIVLEESEEQKKQELLNLIKVGDVIEGVVRRIADFGIFVDIGGTDGLVHVSELSWERVEKPADLFKEGDKIMVKVLKLDPSDNRISLSLKATLPDPWEDAIKNFEIGNYYEGTIRRLISFGAFVELSTFIEGLVHISQISGEHITNPSDVLKTGQKVKVKVLDIKPESKRISLSIREAEEDQLDEISKEFLDNKSLNVTLGDLFGDKLSKFKG
ncbi:MAG: 30S ribosomal protein S1 [Vulcanibacillus sp.]